MEVGFELHAEIEGHNYSGKGNETMDYSQTQGIISHSFPMVMSPFFAHLFPFFKALLKLQGGGLNRAEFGLHY
jgi:hypothetical protein